MQYSNTMAHQPPLPAVTPDGLPKQFIHSLRTLFDILDEQRTGFVKFSDIETRWRDDGSKGLPKGVIESLHKVAPPNGMLSFERFCAGLKICLLKNQMENQKKIDTEQQSNSNDSIRPPSAPLLDSNVKPKWNPSNMATVRPTQQRTLSMPHLPPSEYKENFNNEVESRINVPPNIRQPVLYGPPKPPRSGLGLYQERNIDKAEIRAALQNWQMGLIMNSQEVKRNSQIGAVRSTRSVGDGKSSTNSEQDQQQGYKKVSRRREPRRHTLQNGVDYNMLKKIKQIEQEKDVLLDGLQAVERAREWYLKQIATVQEKMNYIGKIGGHMDHWSEAQQERIELQRARIFEVNRHLLSLIDSSERGGLPLHMNLAVHSPPGVNLLSQLKQQNHHLTKEVTQKSEKINVLEREKNTLLRELYHARRSKQQPHNENTAYI